MTWHAVPAVKAGLREATERWPSRNKASDGTIGDVAHSNRTSDHNPAPDGAVLAFDLTHDPANGCDAHALVRAAVDRRDRRIKYAISNGRIWSAARAAEGWRRYRGSNPHTKHVHVSVNRAHEDDTAPWWLQPLNLGDRLLEQGMGGSDVGELQHLLRVTVDERFGPATHAALVAFQRAAQLDPDGICGPATLAALRRPPAPQGGLMFITNAKGDNRQWLIQNNGGTWIDDPTLSRDLQAKGVPWVRDADPEWVQSVVAGGAKVAAVP